MGDGRLPANDNDGARLQWRAEVAARTLLLIPIRAVLPGGGCVVVTGTGAVPCAGPYVA
jgi:hypothetical protein